MYDHLCGLCSPAVDESQNHCLHPLQTEVCHRVLGDDGSDVPVARNCVKGKVTFF